MTNNYVIVPKVATDDMVKSLYLKADLYYEEEADGCAIANPLEVYKAAISAAPPHNLVAVDKGELRTLKGAYEKIMQISTIEELQSLQSVLAAFYPNLGAK